MALEGFLDAVQAENETALSRLGSSKSLYADTGGEMEPEAVLRAAADAEHAAAETFASWADAEEGQAAEVFRAAAEEEREHYDAVVDELDDHDPGEVPAIQTYLRGLEGTVERAGGFLGRTLAAEKSKSQLAGFFVGQADPGTADLFRELGGDLDGQRDRALDLLASLAEDEEEWERAREAAGDAIQAAYEEYTERLESMGVNPKPVC